MASKKIEFTAKNVKSFTSWLKRFISVDNSLLLEIDESASTFTAKNYNVEHNVVKYSQIQFDDAGLNITKNKEPFKIKVGIFSVPKLIKIFDQFNEEFTLTFTFDEVKEDGKAELAGTLITLKSSSLKINNECTSLKIFNYMSDDKFKKEIAKVEKSIINFPLSKELMDKANSLSTLDNEYKFIEFKKGAHIYMCGKTFELKAHSIEDEWDGKEQSLNIFKYQFDKVDVENYNVEIGDDRLIFTSADSDTVTVISRAEKEE